MDGDPRRTLALDLGDARIGLALSDPTGLTAQPLGALKVEGRKRDAERIAALVREHRVAAIVIGLPLLLSGEEGSRAAHARAWGDRLRGRLAGVRVELWDERLTTVEASRAMRDTGASRGTRKQNVDAMAAVLILQSFLDAGGLDRIESDD
jgi:putative Holliday junction resolvase